MDVETVCEAADVHHQMALKHPDADMRELGQQRLDRVEDVIKKEYGE